MLVLSRGKSQEVIITCGEERIVVTVAEIRGDRVRLGFTASQYVRINRAEVEERDANRTDLPPNSVQL